MSIKKFGNFFSSLKNSFSNIINFSNNNENVDNLSKDNNLGYNPSVNNYSIQNNNYNIVPSTNKLTREQYISNNFINKKEQNEIIKDNNDYNENKKVNSLIKITNYILENKFNNQIDNNNQFLFKNSNKEQMSSYINKNLNNYIEKRTEFSNNLNFDNNKLRKNYTKYIYTPLYNNDNIYLGKKNIIRDTIKENKDEEEKKEIKSQKSESFSKQNNKSLLDIRKEIEEKRKKMKIN